MRFLSSFLRWCLLVVLSGFLPANAVDTCFKQSALTVSLSSPILSALQTGSLMVQAVQNTSSTRMQALAAASLGLAGYEAYTLVDKVLTSDNPTKALAPTLNISLGSSEPA